MSKAPVATAIDRSDKRGSLGLLLLIAGVIVGVGVAAAFLAGDQVRVLIVGVLSMLAMIGVASLFGFAIGLFTTSWRSSRSDLTKAIVDSSKEAILVTDADGKVIYANGAYLKLSNAATPQLIKPVERLFSGAADVSEAIYRLAQAARQEKSLTEEVRIGPAGDPHGEATWYRIRVRPVTRPRGAAALWAIQDVTHEREGHENVFQELQQAIDYLDHAPAGFLSVEPDGAIAHINATLASWLDHDLASFAPGRQKLADIVAGDGAALLSGASGPAGEVRTGSFAIDLKKRTGHTLPVQVIHSVAFGSDGAPGASRTIVLKRGGEARAEEGGEMRFARFFHATPMAIATVRRDGALVRHNAAFARLTSTAPASDNGERSVLHAVSDRDRDKLTSAIAAAAAGQVDIAPVDATLAGDGGRTARLFLSVVDETADQGEAAVVYALETSEQRKLEEQFAQAQKMQAVGQLAGGIAHDFNNMLQAIIGYSDLLLANHRPTDPSFPDIMQIKQNANRAAGLVRQLLAFSRRQTLRPRILALNETLADFSNLCRRLIGERIEFDLRHGRDLWPVKADVNQFEQVVMNLVVNARDAMPNGGKLSIRTSNVKADEVDTARNEGMIRADHVLIEVQDTGTGIPPAVKEKIFDPFFTTKEVGKGTGLGLSTVYGIVKQTGGYIYVDSVVGEGTTFRIYLPRASAEDEAEESATDAPAASPDAPKPRAPDLTGQGTILLVEDEEAVRRFAERALTRHGYRVLVAESGLEGLEVANAHQGVINLILSDVVMPEMDGPTMIKELRKSRPDARVVFMSGHAEDAFEKNLDEDVKFGFIAKPFALKDLAETVKKAMAG
ncbi:cell cycle histidine kinase CckA [Terrarubrum flagellatum]|uniref:cell cycle histidine kinase CckA n=1 Tax=Terrirubrum flagellatum TaxID=2895980 RepID=UPI0031455F10